jgi:hypothetical protein
LASRAPLTNGHPPLGTREADVSTLRDRCGKYVLDRCAGSERPYCQPQQRRLVLRASSRGSLSTSESPKLRGSGLSPGTGGTQANVVYWSLGAGDTQSSVVKWRGLLPKSSSVRAPDSRGHKKETTFKFEAGVRQQARRMYEPRARGEQAHESQRHDRRTGDSMISRTAARRRPSSMMTTWSGKRDSNPRPSAWEAESQACRRRRPHSRASSRTPGFHIPRLGHSEACWRRRGLQVRGDSRGGGPSGARTQDTRIKSPVLYQLS